MTEDNAKTGNVGRALGPFESFSACLTMDSVGLYWHAVVLNTFYELRMKDVHKACQILASKQEALQMRIVQTSYLNKERPAFKFIPMDDPEKIDIGSNVIQQKDDWPLYISKDLEDNHMDIVNGPLWRFILLRVEKPDSCSTFPFQYVVLLKLAHTISDGLSAFDLLNNQLLPILSAIINGKDAENMIPFVPQTTSAEESIQSTNNPISGYFKWLLDFRRFKNRIFKLNKQPHYRFANEKQSRDVPCIPKIFDKTVCRSVMIASTTNEVKVHSVLLLAGVVAFSRTAKLADIELPSHIKQTWPISLRKYLTFKPPEPLGFLIAEGSTVHETVTEITMEEFWKRCKELSIHVKEERNLEKCKEYLKVNQYIYNAANNTSLLAILSEMGAPSHLFLSNLGNTDIKDSTRITSNEDLMKVTEQYFCLTGLKDDCFPTFAQYLITFKNRFMWNVTYNPSRISKLFVEKYLLELENVLRLFCASSVD